MQTNKTKNRSSLMLAYLSIFMAGFFLNTVMPVSASRANAPLSLDQKTAEGVSVTPFVNKAGTSGYLSVKYNECEKNCTQRFNINKETLVYLMKDRRSV